MSGWQQQGNPWHDPSKKLKMTGPAGMRNTGAKFPKAPKAQMLPNVNVAGLPNPKVKNITTGGKSGAVQHPSKVLINPPTPIKGKKGKKTLHPSALSQSYTAPTTAIQQPMLTVPSAPAQSGQMGSQQQPFVAQQQGAVAQPQAPAPPPNKAQILQAASKAAYDERQDAIVKTSKMGYMNPAQLVQHLPQTQSVAALKALSTDLWTSWLQSKRRRDAYNSIGLKRDQVINQRFVDAARQMPERRAARKSAIWARKQRFRRAMGWGRPELGVLPSRAMGYVV